MSINTIKALEQEKEEILSTLRIVEDALAALKKRYGISSESTNGSQSKTTVPALSNINEKYRAYYSAKSNRDKVIAILKAEGKFLHIRQFVSIAQSLEPNEDKNYIKSKISQAVYNLKSMENSPIVSHAVNKSNLNTFWGSRNWVDSKGNPKPEFMYDEEQLSSNKSEPIEI